MGLSVPFARGKPIHFLAEGRLCAAFQHWVMWIWQFIGGSGSGRRFNSIFGHGAQAQDVEKNIGVTHPGTLLQVVRLREKG